MTDKRFNRVGGYIYDGEKCISHFEDVKHRDDIITLLNELHEEKELEHKRVNYLKRIVAENCPTSLLIQVQNDLEWIE